MGKVIVLFQFPGFKTRIFSSYIIGYFLDSESIAATCDNADDIANIADADAVLRCQVTTHRAGVRSAIRRYNAHHYGPRNTLVMFYSL